MDKRIEAAEKYARALPAVGDIAGQARAWHAVRHLCKALGLVSGSGETGQRETLEFILGLAKEAGNG